jgi:hypothetical protein
MQAALAAYLAEDHTWTAQQSFADFYLLDNGTATYKSVDLFNGAVRVNGTAIGGGGGTWGSITGTLSSQTDLQTALDNKLAASVTKSELNTAVSDGDVLYVGDVTSNANHTGDATGSTALTLATVNSNVGTFGSATQASVVTVNAKGLVTAASQSTVTPAVGSITGLGTGVGTALAIAVGSAGGPVTNGGALGTPSSGTVTNLTGTASININGTVGATTPTTVAGTTGTFSGVVQPRRLLINGQNSEWPIDVYTSNGVTRIFSVVNGTGDCFSAGTFSSATGFRVTAFGSYIGVLADSNVVFNNGNIVTNISGTQRLLLNSTGLSITGSLTVNSGTAITKILSATATLDFGSIAANSFADLTITVTGAAVGDTVSLGVPNGSLLNDISFFGWVSATNTVTIRCSNVSSTTARDPASGTFRATVTQF